MFNHTQRVFLPPKGRHSGAAIQDDRQIKIRRADGTEIQSWYSVVSAFSRQGFKFVGKWEKSTQGGCVFLHQEAIYTGPVNGLLHALGLVTKELGEECMYVDDPGSFKLRLAYEGEADLIDTVRQVRREHEAAEYRLNWVKEQLEAYPGDGYYEDELDDANEHLADTKFAVSMWSRDLRLVRSGVPIAEVVDRSDAEAEIEEMAAA